MKKLERREFIKATTAASVLGSSAFLLSCGNNNKSEAPNIISNKKYEWKLVTTWNPHYPVIGEYADKFAQLVEKLSNGRLKIQVYGGGELVPPFEVFDAVSSGVAECGHGAAYYWAGKIAASQFFTAVPFGMNAQQTNAWFYFGDGLKLWQETYQPYNITVFPCGNTTGQMGGWFNKEINSVNDFNGLKIRMPGLGGKIVSKLGATTVLSPAAELYTNLERGIIDALEWIAPYHDYLMGFQRIAKYYYYPGWQEPNGALEIIINKSAYDSLSEDLKLIVQNAAKAVNDSIGEMLTKNYEYYEKIKNETNVQFRKFNDDILTALREKSSEVINEIISNDAQSKKVYESYIKFQKQMSEWYSIGEQINLNI